MKKMYMLSNSLFYSIWNKSKLFTVFYMIYFVGDVIWRYFIFNNYYLIY